MPRTLYYQVQFIRLHQKNPGYDPGAAPTLEINGVRTNHPKYRIEIGNGDPNEAPHLDGSDYSEFRIVGASFTRPADFDKKSQYITETGTKTYSVYLTVTVPDDFSIPWDIPGLGAEPTVPTGPGTIVLPPTTPFGDASDFFKPTGQFSFDWSVYHLQGRQGVALSAVETAFGNVVSQALTVAVGSSLAQTIQNAMSLNGTMRTFVEAQFNLLDRGLSNFSTMTAAQFEALTNQSLGQARDLFILELINQLQKFGPTPPAGIVSLAGFQHEWGANWAHHAAELIVDGFNLSFAEGRTVQSGVNSDRQGEIHFGYNTFGYSTRDDFVIAQSSQGVRIETSAGNDIIVTGDGRDTIIPGMGNDRVAGGAGLDTAIYSDQPMSYIWSGNHNDAVTVYEYFGGVIGNIASSDQLIGVERIHFRDRVIAFDNNGNAGDAYRIYQAAFDRTPDRSGLSYWVNQMDEGMPLSQVALNFILSQEFATTYGNINAMSNAQFVNVVYQNVLHRAPDTGGFNYWMNDLSNGYPRHYMLAAFSQSAENQANVAAAIRYGIELDLGAFV